GVRKTFDVLDRYIPIQRPELPTGTTVLDWEVPREWNISDAYIKNTKGERVVDFQRSNLHVLNYSVPVRRKMTFADLRPHLYTVPDQPDLVPYRTSYYKEAWGFCIAHNQLIDMEKSGEEYEVVIDSRLDRGKLIWGEHLHVGETADEVLL